MNRRFRLENLRYLTIRTFQGVSRKETTRSWWIWRRRRDFQSSGDWNSRPSGPGVLPSADPTSPRHLHRDQPWEDRPRAVRPATRRPGPARRLAPGRRPAGLGERRSGSTCTCRSARCAAATATSTPTPRSSWGSGAPVSQASYAALAADEVRPGRARARRASAAGATVFVGGGTPTLLPATDLVGLLRVVDDELGLAADVEVTTEANPDSVTAESLQQLREGGFTRVSFGMQSAVRTCCATLDRTHDPERVPQAVAWARAAGFDEISLDLIYGTPGESLDDWPPVSTLRWPASPTTCRRTRSSSRTAPPWPGRSSGARSPRPTTTTWPTSTSSPTSGSPPPAWSGTSCPTGRDGRPAGAATTSSTGPVPTGGDRAGRAQPCRRRAVVERPAPRGVRRPPGRARESGPGPRGARRGDPPRRAGAAGDPPGRGRGPRRARPRRSRRRARPRRRGPGLGGRRQRPARRCADGCSPTPSSAACCPDPPPGRRRSRPRAGLI